MFGIQQPVWCMDEGVSHLSRPLDLWSLRRRPALKVLRTELAQIQEVHAETLPCCAPLEIANQLDR